MPSFKKNWTFRLCNHHEAFMHSVFTATGFYRTVYWHVQCISLTHSHRKVWNQPQTNTHLHLLNHQWSHSSPPQPLRWPHIMKSHCMSLPLKISCFQDILLVPNAVIQPRHWSFGPLGLMPYLIWITFCLLLFTTAPSTLEGPHTSANSVPKGLAGLSTAQFPRWISPSLQLIKSILRHRKTP